MYLLLQFYQHVYMRRAHRLPLCAWTKVCCIHTMIFDVRDPQTGKLVGNVQKMYAQTTNSDCAACCRMIAGFDTFVIQLPTESSR